MIKIDIDTRCWQIPKQECFLGVESDDKVRILQFELSKNEFCDGLNFTDCNCFINYKNDGNDTIPYAITDMEVQEDGTVTFTWEVSRGATIFKGNTFAVLCAKKVREDGTIMNEWNSRIGSFTVSKGLEPLSSIVEVPEIDIISQLLLVAQKTNANAQTNINQSSSLLEKAEGLGYLKEEYDVLEARMNQFTSLQEGSTTGDAELIDGRIGYDGKVYENIGGAIRKQVGELKGDLIEIESSVYTVLEHGDTTVVTSPQLADIKSIKVGKISNTYHQTRYDSELATDSNYKTLDAIEFYDESAKSLRMNFKPSNISCYRASDGTFEGVIPVSNVIDNGDGSFSVTINANIKPKYVRISWGLVSYPNLVPLITLESEWDADADATFIGSKTVYSGGGLKSKTVTITSLSDEVKEYIEEQGVLPTSDNPCDYNGNEICMLGKGLCIGDSLTYGQFDKNESGSTQGFRKEQMNYPSNLARMTGLELTNAGHAGKTFQTWWDAHSTDDLSGYDFCIIALGVNDGYFNGGWTDGALTALTNIVNKVRAENKDIPIFITTPPMYFLGYNGCDFNSVRTGIRDASASLGLYLVDFGKYLTEFTRENYALVSETPYGHYNAYGYYATAKAYKAYISYIVKNNLSAFKNVQFVGTDYSWS